MVARFGIRSLIEPYLPIALGATDMKLLELTSAYSTFPNDGVRVEPRLINRVSDYDDDILEENFPEPHDVITSDVAAQMVDLLREVVTSGTASAHNRSADLLPEKPEPPTTLPMPGSSVSHHL